MDDSARCEKMTIESPLEEALACGARVIGSSMMLALAARGIGSAVAAAAAAVVVGKAVALTN